MLRRFLLTGLVLVAVVGFACSGDKDQDQVPVSEPIVQVVIGVGTGEEFVPAFSGSGTIIDSDGLILTNLHVVDPEEPWDSIAIYTVDDPKQPPQLSYFAAIASFDRSLDIAVLKIVANSRGEAVSADGLPTVVLGDSDSLEVGDDLRILGFPDIGGDTLTLTEGIVSGFVSDPSRPTQSRWIKTDAEISEGNSGGAALSEGEELVAIPTAIVVGAESPTALGQLLPINFASDLLVEARATRPSQYVTQGRHGSGPTSDDAYEPSASYPSLVEISIGSLVIDAEVAQTPDQRAQGLSGRDSLPANAGMLFVFEEERQPGFWMREMQFPLDFIWISADSFVVDLTEDVPPPAPGTSESDLPLYQPDAPVLAVLEVNGGVIREAALRVGDLVDIRLLDDEDPLDNEEPQCTYSGPYSFSGSTETVTDDFCITANLVRVDYSARGTGYFPDIYYVGISLYDELGSLLSWEFVDTESGRINLKNDGPGYYYLQLEPSDAAWEVTISQ